MKIQARPFTALALVAFVGTCHAAASAQEPTDIAAKIKPLVRQLDADDRARRDAAEDDLIQLGSAAGSETGAEFLDALPAPGPNMPEEVRTRLARIRQKVYDNLIKRAMAESRVSLDVDNAPLAQVLESMDKQSGNRLTDYREKFGQETTAKLITLKVDNQPFWSAFDQVLDAAHMSPYAYSGESALAIIEREPGALRRFGRAAYSGPFRIEATSIEARRGLRSPDQSGLQVQLEFSWEPRLQPLALSQAARDLKAFTDDDIEIEPAAHDAVFEVEVPSGSYAAEAILSLKLPGRGSRGLKSIRGKMIALTPGRTVDLTFENLAKAEDVTQRTGGVAVTLDRAFKNGAVWEVHMRIQVTSLDEGIESYRGWVFQNVTWLQHKDGAKVDTAGFETTMQNEREAGFAYLFDIPGDIADYSWVYRTPTAIVNVPVEYELTDVPLP